MLHQEVLLVALFAFGLSYAQAKLTGPFGLSDALRMWANQHAPGWVKDGVSCPYCIAFWIALIGAALFLPMPVPDFFILWLAGYGLTCFGLLYVGV